ncbi:MAG: macro domain-containing protein [Clostridiaceae bacterium]
MPLEIIRNDIVYVHADAIVNATNSALKKGGGVSGAIFDAAGSERLQKECDKIGSCGVGKAVITSGYDLPSKYIVHTVGPTWYGGYHDEARYLADCYKNSLALAQQYGCESIAFPLISSGKHDYPKDQALKTAISSIGDFLMHHEMDVFLVVYDSQSFVLSEKLFKSIESYIDDNYVGIRLKSMRSRNSELFDVCDKQFFNKYRIEKNERKLEDLVGHLEESFSQMLLRLIDEKEQTDANTYKKANIDRRLFSKIRSDIHYKPSKSTALAFAIALELNLDETKDLLKTAGYALSRSNIPDLIYEYFIKDGNYDIMEINGVLFYYEQQALSK